MLSYRHLFHAGNFADVFKHALLTRLLAAMSAKDKPYLYLDTHAGIARYDLKHAWAQKAREYENGIARVWKAKDAPEGLAPYLDAVRTLNPDGSCATTRALHSLRAVLCVPPTAWCWWSSTSPTTKS